MMNGTRDAEARGETAVARENRVTKIRALFGLQRKGEVEPVSSQKSTRAIRPFDENKCTFAGFVPAELFQFLRRADAVEIGMDDRKVQAVIDLHQRECRAGHVESGVAGEAADQCPRKGRLAGAEIAAEGQKVARLQPMREFDGKRRRRRFIGKDDLPDCGLRPLWRHRLDTPHRKRPDPAVNAKRIPKINLGRPWIVRYPTALSIWPRL